MIPKYTYKYRLKLKDCCLEIKPFEVKPPCLQGLLACRDDRI